MQNFLLGSPLQLCRDADPSDDESDITKPFTAQPKSAAFQRSMFSDSSPLFPNDTSLETLEKAFTSLQEEPFL